VDALDHVGGAVYAFVSTVQDAIEVDDQRVVTSRQRAAVLVEHAHPEGRSRLTAPPADDPDGAGALIRRCD
jgi:hypothetical protein